jgi:hypothetical protein
MLKVTPSSLPDIAAIEVVDLRNVRHGADGFMPYAQSAPCWNVIGEEAQAIALLWRQLPPGEQARCHVPTFGFRFYAEKLVFEASVCWMCDNIIGDDTGRKVFFPFDSSHFIAQQLLEWAQRISGISQSEEQVS